MPQIEYEKERKTRITLERFLKPGEELLEFTRCRKVGLIRSDTYFVGLTPDRLIFNPVKSGMILNTSLSIRLASIRSLQWKRGLWQRVNIKLAREVVNLRFKSGLSVRERYWAKRGKGLYDLAQERVRSLTRSDRGSAFLGNRSGTVSKAGSINSQGEIFQPKELTGEQHVMQARDFEAFGFEGSALHELNEALSVQPELIMEVDVKELQDRLLAVFNALRRVGLFFLVAAGIMMLIASILFVHGGSEALAAYIDSSSVILFVTAIYLGINLYKGRSDKRTWALYLASIWLILAGIVLLAITSMPSASVIVWDILMQLALSIAIILPLTGSKSPRRTLIATIIFVLGYLFPSLVFLIAALV